MEGKATAARHVVQAIFGFVAGFFATIIFHQLSLALLRHWGVAPFAPFNMTPTHPFGIPAVISLSLWGGIWGIVFAFLTRLLPRGPLYWVGSFLFGALFPSAAALLVVMPLKGLPLGGGWHAALLVTVFIVNGMWGIGTALILKLLSALRPVSSA